MLGRLSGWKPRGESVVRIGRQRYRKRVRLLTYGPPGVRGFIEVDVGGSHGSRNAGNPHMVCTGAEQTAPEVDVNPSAWFHARLREGGS
eukprot:4060926-Pleurochrysis_carterae.AAC.1